MNDYEHLSPIIPGVKCFRMFLGWQRWIWAFGKLLVALAFVICACTWVTIYLKRFWTVLLLSPQDIYCKPVDNKSIGYDELLTHFDIALLIIACVIMGHSGIMKFLDYFKK